MSKNKKKGFFITGTDTDIGKTYISKLIADNLSNKDRVTYMKPVQTGCTKDTEKNLTAPDFDYVMSGKAIRTGTYDQHVPYRFEPACSPHLAAQLASEPLTINHICECFEKISLHDVITIVEGAGGILVPLNEKDNMLDLMFHLELPVILVTAPKLGTLNHTFLSLNALKEKGIKTAGVVMNNINNESKNFIYNDNRRMIREFIRPLPFLEVQYESTNISIEKFCDEIKQFI